MRSTLRAVPANWTCPLFPQNDLAQLRSLQDWQLRYQLQSVPGVAEVASIGGFQKQYQVHIDPTKLLAFNIPISTVVQAIRDGNNDVGGRLVEFTGAEYMVRGRGYAKSVKDIEKIVVRRTSRARRSWSRTSASLRLARTSAAAWPISTARGTRSAESSSCGPARMP